MELLPLMVFMDGDEKRAIILNPDEKTTLRDGTEVELMPLIGN